MHSTKHGKNSKTPEKSETKTSTNNNNNILKQALQAKAQRLRRYTKRSEQYKQNKMFREDSKRFYRELGKKTHPE